MIWLIVSLVIIFSVLLFPISVNIKFDKGLKFKVKILNFNIFTYPDNSNKKSNIEKEKQDNKKISLENSVNKISLYFEIVKDILSALSKHIKSLNIKEYRFDFLCGLGDAALTGIFFGGVYAVVNSFHAYLFDNYKIKKKNVNVSPDFENKCLDFCFVLKFNISLYWILKLFYKERNVFKKIINKIKKDGV